MNMNGKSELSMASPFELPFHRKPNIVLTRLFDHSHFQECLRKTVSIAQSDRLIFEEVLRHLKEFLREEEGGREGGSAVSIEGGERGDELYYDITRSFIKCNTLKECLLEEKCPFGPLPPVLSSLLSAYLRSILLNHIVCSSSNIFFAHKTWSKQPVFEFNYTSLGFLFDSCCKRPICQADLAEYANYLPRGFYQEPAVKSRFDFYLKLRSFAVNLLSIVLQRDLDFVRSHSSFDLYPQEQILTVLVKIHSHFQELLGNSKIQNKIEAASTVLNVDLLTFFRAVILQPETAQFEQFNSWGKMIQYFKHPFLASCQKIFQLELSVVAPKFKTPSGSYLEGWVRQMWASEHEYVRKQFRMLGIVGREEGTCDLILYLLCRHRLINGPHFESGDETYHPGLLKLVLTLYSKIIGSDFLLEPVAPCQMQEAKLRRDKFLCAVVARVSGALSDLSIKNGPKERFLFVSKDGVDLKTAYQQCWHFRSI